MRFNHLRTSPASPYVEIAGLCVNGTFVASQKNQAFPTINLPLQTYTALQEAIAGVTGEQVGNLLK
jgi:hypothetical protein